MKILDWTVWIDRNVCWSWSQIIPFRWLRRKCLRHVVWGDKRCVHSAQVQPQTRHFMSRELNICWHIIKALDTATSRVVCRAHTVTQSWIHYKFYYNQNINCNKTQTMTNWIKILKRINPCTYLLSPWWDISDDVIILIILKVISSLVLLLHF